jgi:ELWxxDGT repeat protein
MDINTNINSIPANLVVMNGVTYFVATDDSTGLELWKSNGTDAGTVQVKGIYTGSASSSPSDLMVVGSALFFRANDGDICTELWKSDGTAAGTELVRDINVITGAGSNLSILNE